MEANTGGHVFDDHDDEPGSTTLAEHHWRCEVTSDHLMADNTPYDKISDSDYKRMYISGYFTETPISPYGTDVTYESYQAWLEPQDNGNTETRSPEPDPNDSPHQMLWDISVSIGIGPVAITHSLQSPSLSFTDTNYGNQYWMHWEVPTGDMPAGTGDAHGASAILDTLHPPDASFSVGSWAKSLYSYVDPSWSGTAFQETDVSGGFAEYTVVDGDQY